MKKFLAALLAVVMVVSLVPATVFAAATSEECAVEKAFGTHSKRLCTLLGVDFEQVGEPVVGACGQDGYTMFKCECGVYFADDIVEMPDHEYDVTATPDVLREEPTCTKYGQAAGYKCEICGEIAYVFKTGDKKATGTGVPADQGWIAMAAHKWASPSYDAADCTASKQYCSVCGTENKNHKPAKEHNFNYNDPFAIITNSTTCAPGVAVFKCTTKGCEIEKEVPVDITGHTKETLKLVNAKAGTCTTAGTKEYYECKTCKTKFLEQKDGTLKIVTSDDELKTAVGHSFGENPSYSVLATCTTYGADYYFCELCGFLDVKNEKAPIGHTTYDEAVAHDADKNKVKKDGKWITVVEAESCTDQTTYTWACHKKCLCNADPENPKEAVCGYEGKLTTKKDAAKGHAKENIPVPATVKNPVAYTITICTNENCDAKHIASKTWTKDGVTYTLPTEVKVVGDNVYEMTPEEKEGYHVIDVTGMKVVKNIKGCTDADIGCFYELDDDAVNKPATCTEAGFNVYFCNACNNVVTLGVAKLGHNYDLEEGATIVGGVYECASKVYVECANGCGSTKEYKNGLGHVYDFDAKPEKEVKIATCQESAGKYYSCEECGKVTIKDEVKYEYTPYFDTLKDAENVHGELTEKKIVAGNCNKRGHVEYQCADCGFMIWVFDETTGKHLAPEGTPNHKEATCHYGKGLDAFTCVRCGEEVAAEGQPLEHVMTKVTAQKATCLADGNYEYYTCSRDCCKKNVGTTSKPKYELFKYKMIKGEDEDGEEVITYVKYEDDSWKIAKLGHDYEETTTIVPGSCATHGYTHQICANGCGTERVYGVVKATEHKKGEKVYKAPTCIVEGYENYKCTNPGCTGTDGIAGNEDDGFYSVKKLPALGHINAAGQVIENKCTDTVSDRVCVLCNDKKNPCSDACSADLKLNSKTKKYEVKKDHDEVAEYFPATYETPAYNLITCANGCGDINKFEYVSDPLGHVFAWGDLAGYTSVPSANIKEKGEEFIALGKDAFNAKYGENAIVAYSPATAGNDGSVEFKCKICEQGIVLPVIRANVNFVLDLDNAVASNESGVYFEGDVIAIDVSLDATQTNVWGFNFELEYNSLTMNYLGYKFHADNKFANYMVNNKVTDYPFVDDVNGDGKDEAGIVMDAMGSIKVSAYTENALDGTMVDVLISDKTKVVTLYFQLDDVFEYVLSGVNFTENFYDTFGSDGIFAYMNAPTVSNSVEDDDIDVSCNDIWAEFYGMMDVNMSNTFNITDLQYCVMIIKGQSNVEYMAACDVNKDGAVNLTDLDLMNKYLVGKIDAFDIYEELSWSAPKGFVAA